MIFFQISHSFSRSLAKHCLTLGKTTLYQLSTKFHNLSPWLLVSFQPGMILSLSLSLSLYLYLSLSLSHTHTNMCTCIEEKSVLPSPSFSFPYEKSLRRCPWCNGYRRRKWTRQHEFKTWRRLIAFHIALIPLGKV